MSDEVEVLRERVMELEAQVDMVTRDEMLLALGREMGNSPVLRTFRALIRERRLMASVAASNPLEENVAHACGGIFALDELDSALVELWKEGRKYVKELKR